MHIHVALILSHHRAEIAYIYNVISCQVIIIIKKHFGVVRNVLQLSINLLPPRQAHNQLENGRGQKRALIFATIKK